MTSRKAIKRIEFILLYEPSWFGEFISASGIFLWALATLWTDDFAISGWAWFMPAVGIVFGPLRVLLLFHLDPLPRVLAACGGFVWWSWLCWSMFLIFGIVPTLGAFAALVVGDILTVSKFSLAVLRVNKGYGDGL